MSPTNVVPSGEQVWGADRLEIIVKRNADWLQKFIVAGVRAVLKDGRPLFTDKISPKERVKAILEAPPEFWAALEQQSPEAAAELVAQVIKARMKGQIPLEGPRAEEVNPNDFSIEESQLGAPGTGTERPLLFPKFPKTTLIE